MTREHIITKFLRDADWGDAKRSPIDGDASARRYERLSRASGHHPNQAILLDAAPNLEGVVCPPNASDEQRNTLGYTAQARLAGTNPHAFVCIAKSLWQRGFAAPKILAADLEHGLILLEDLGSKLVAATLQQNPDQERPIYDAAIDCLAEIYRSSFDVDMIAKGGDYLAKWHVGEYDDLALQTEADLLLEWYVPEFEKGLGEAAKQAWYDIWKNQFLSLNHQAKGLALRDFHAENIFALRDEGAEDHKIRMGLIDFQDALFAHPAYDLVSLLEDARRDVSLELIPDLLARFCHKAGIELNEAFMRAYHVMGAQRNAKILGIFVRLAQRDGKEKYLTLLPRVADHFVRDLSHPDLSDLRQWFTAHAPSVFETAKQFTKEQS